MGYDDVLCIVLCSIFLSLVLVFAKFRFGCRLENCTVKAYSSFFMAKLKSSWSLDLPACGQ